MKIATIEQENETQVAVKFPYNADAVAALKSAVPWQSRKWDAKGKFWLVTEAEVEAAIAAIAPYFDQVLDARTGADIEEAQIEAELSQIKANQAYILENRARIEREITELEAAVDNYSYRSKSSRKSSMATDAALLRHSLGNAQQPAEQLTEMQVRGLAAAVRLLRK